jgi:sugar/nucleoside kinase (ribokinase family)
VDIVTVGEAFEDLIFAGLRRLPRPGEEIRVPTFHATIGGGAVITAIAAARLGLTVGVLTAIDGRGATTLRSERIKLINVRKPAERTAVSVALSTARDRSFVTFEGANRVLEPRLRRQLRGVVGRPRHIHFALGPSNCRAWVGIVNDLRAKGVTTSWDFGWNERLAADRGFATLGRALDWVFVNEQEARLYSRALAGARNTIIKRGANGATLATSQGTLRLAAPRARVLDTTGAGDAFNGGFLAALARGGNARAALRLANYIGARSTEGIGGIASLPVADALPVWARRTLGAQ